MSGPIPYIPYALLPLWLSLLASAMRLEQVEVLDAMASPPCGDDFAEVIPMEDGVEGYKLHCDDQLRQLRDVFQVPDPEEILDSNQIDLAHAEEGTGKSGAKMLFSRDKKYIIKTMSSRDIGALGKMITPYVTRVVAQASSTMLMRFFAIIEDERGDFWVIANNWLPVEFPIVWDLKGSTVGRSNGVESASQKDKDWLKDSRDLALPDSQRASILQALEGDSKLLARSRLIDYSLIVGRLVYQLEPCEERSCIAPVCHPDGCGEAAHGFGDDFNEIKDFYCQGSAVKERELGHTCIGSFTSDLKVYFECFGLIDLLKPYDLKSRGEYAVRGGWGRALSVQPPDTYAERFFKFMHEKVFPADLALKTVPLVFSPGLCAAWGSHDRSKGSNFVVITVVAVILGLAGGLGLAAWCIRKKRTETVGGASLQAYQPHNPQGGVGAEAYQWPTSHYG